MTARIIRKRGSLIAPLVFFSLCLLLVLLVRFVDPTFTQMYVDFGMELPLVTQLIVGASNFLNASPILTTGILTLLVGGMLAVISFKTDRKLGGIFWVLSAIVFLLGVLAVYSLFMTNIGGNMVVGR